MAVVSGRQDGLDLRARRAGLRSVPLLVLAKGVLQLGEVSPPGSQGRTVWAPAVPAGLCARNIEQGRAVTQWEGTSLPGMHTA